MDLYQRIFPPLLASLAFPESEKQEKVPGDDPCEDTPPSSTPVDQDSSIFTPESSDPIPETPVSMFIHDSPTTDTTTDPSQDLSSVKDELSSPNSSLSDHQDKDDSDLLLIEDDLGLDSLFKEVIHVHAEKPQVPRQPKRGPSRSPKRVSSKSPAVNLQGRKIKKTTFISEGLCMLIQSTCFVNMCK